MPRTCSASPTSQPIIVERGLVRRTSFKASFSFTIERPQPTTMAPRAAKSMASCRPIPLDAPVITMTRFRKFIGKFSLRTLCDSISERLTAFERRLESAIAKLTAALFKGRNDPLIRQQPIRQIAKRKSNAHAGTRAEHDWPHGFIFAEPQLTHS